MPKRNKSEEELLNKELNQQLRDLWKQYKPVYGREDDIMMLDIALTLKTKKRLDEQNALLTRLIYLIKKNLNDNK